MSESSAVRARISEHWEGLPGHTLFVINRSTHEDIQVSINTTGTNFWTILTNTSTQTYKSDHLNCQSGLQRGIRGRYSIRMTCKKVIHASINVVGLSCYHLQHHKPPLPYQTQSPYHPASHLSLIRPSHLTILLATSPLSGPVTLPSC